MLVRLDSHIWGHKVDSVEVLVIGAGVVGLAIAKTLSVAGHEVVVCEKENTVGQGISARNSGVVHAGLYYPKDSLKAQFCVAGRQQLYAFCQDFHVPFKITGKLVVAAEKEEVEGLYFLRKKAELNGVTDLAFLSADQVSNIEPQLKTYGALLSPSTGIVDVHQFMLALLGQLEANKGFVAFNTEIESIVKHGDGLLVATKGGDKIHANIVINCAGLGAQKVAASVDGLSDMFIPKLRMVRGQYFLQQGALPFRKLVYPLPVKGGLGIHATLDLAGSLRFGPDVQPCIIEDYRPDCSREDQFREAISRYYPGVEDKELTLDYVGIRPQIAPLGQFADFMISTEQQHGVKGLVNLFGVESPGLTSALALAKYVGDLCWK